MTRFSFFSPAALWIVDFTYLRCGEGWGYLVAVRDAHSRRALAESFWASLKVEHFYRHAYATREQVYESVDEWIDVSCNHQRIHTALGGPSPVEYEPALARRAREAA